MLAVKGNQGKQHSHLQALFTKADTLDYQSMLSGQETILEKDHGRIETRE